MFTRCQVMLDLPKDPRIPLGSPANEQSVSTRFIQNRLRLLRRNDVTIRKN